MVRTMAQVFGWVFIVIGVLGFVPGVTTEDGLLLGLFQVDTIHNLIHLVSGAAALYAASVGAARKYFQIFGVIYALIAVLGFFYGDSELLGFIAHNTADTWLHVVIAVVALYLGFGTKDEA